MLLLAQHYWRYTGDAGAIGVVSWDAGYPGGPGRQMLERCDHEAVANHQPGASLPAGYSYVSLIQDAAGDSRQWFLGELLSDRVRVYAVFNVIYLCCCVHQWYSCHNR